MKLTAITQHYSNQITQPKQKGNRNTPKLSTPAFKNWYTNYDVEKYKETFRNSLKQKFI